MRSFTDDRTLLRGVLEDVMRAGGNDAALALHERTVELARAARDGDPSAADELAAEIAACDAPALEGLVRSLTRWFQLINLVEDNQRIRRLRARAEDGPDRQPGSLRDTVRRLAEQGTSADDLAAMLAGAELSLVLTAHPTEARRRTTIDKLARAFAILRDLDERAPAPGAEADARDQLRVIVQELWASDEVRAVSPTVLDEVRSGLAYFQTTLATTVPVFYRELERAVAAAYPDAEVPVPALLSFGSWMGGDRDGNPFVTPAMTEDALDRGRWPSSRTGSSTTATPPRPRCWRTCGSSKRRSRATGPPSSPAGTCATSSAPWRCSASTSAASTCARTPRCTGRRSRRSSARSAGATTRRSTRRGGWRRSPARSPTRARSSPSTAASSATRRRRRWRRSARSSACSRAATGGPCAPTSSPTPPAPPICSRCCCS